MTFDFTPTGLAVPVASRLKMISPPGGRFLSRSFRPTVAKDLAGEPKSRLMSEVEGPAVPHSGKLTGLEFRITNVFVRDNATKWIWPFIRYSDLYVLAFVQTNLDAQPLGVTLDGFEDIDDNQALAFEYAPYTKVFKDGDRFPDALHCFFSIVKSKKDIRDFGAALTKVLASDQYKAATTALTTVISAAASAGSAGIASVVIPAMGAVANVLGTVLQDVTDKVLSRHIASFTAVNGDFDEIGRHDLTWKDQYCNIDYRLTVRGLH